ncbi:hypothetical protein Cgig2_030871 [Carnegiea gigantea]|uniref:Transposase MuDR plant domain-containing protein n=1 Tax=Carnegiea gigantea TaxID=171969 RepID=A0A9Q1KHT8_9CARY|nr:hypothetical protein Cgig2_030871 [Carnegiea gigantea]
MALGHQLVDEDGSGSQLVVNKMAKVFQKCRLWSKGRDEKVKLAPGDIFTCKKDLLKVMRKYCVQEGVSFRKLRNDRKRYTHKCFDSRCTFRIHASVLVDNITWIIRRIAGSHVCPVAEENEMANSRWVASHLLEHFRSNPNMDGKCTQDIIMRRYEVFVPDHICWTARRFVKEIIKGKHDEGYRVLPKYMAQFHERNAKSGIIKAIKKIMPQASKRICVMHFYKNFACQYTGTWFHRFFYTAANACSPYVFTKAMDKIQEKDASAYHWLKDNEPLEHWARIKFDKALKSDDNTNNFVESFNNAIVKHWGKPVYNMLEKIRFDRRFQLVASWDGKVTPYVEKKLRIIEIEARKCNNIVPDYCLTVTLFLYLEHYISNMSQIHAYFDSSMRKKSLAFSVL